LKRPCPIPVVMLDSTVDQRLEGLLAAVPPGFDTANSDDNQFRLDGDFYAQGDDNVRLGVSMTWAHDLPAAEVLSEDTNTFDLDLQPASVAPAAKFDSLDIDALKPLACNLCEGKTRSADEVPSTNLPHVGTAGESSTTLAPHVRTAGRSANCAQSSSVMQTNLCMPPPSLPTDPCFRLEPTTLRLRGVFAGDLWHCLVLFFEALSAATVTKVSPMKHAINAEVWLDFGKCALKVRIYTGENGTLAVQVQRCDGDSVCFSRIFLHLFKHIAEQLAAASMEPFVAAMQDLLRPHCLPSGIGLEQQVPPCQSSWGAC